MIKKYILTGFCLIIATFELLGQPPKQIVVDGKTFPDLNNDGKLQPYEDTRLPNNRRISDLMTRLTVDDKINLVLGTGMKGFEGLIKDMVVGGTEYLDRKSVV